MQSTVNISNYEEFFLLYVDGELSAADKLAVEQFVQANPGLAVELEMLQQVQLTGDPLVFADKNSLYRSEAAEINLHNYEEQFLLYVDNELKYREKDNVERFVLQHPSLQESFTQFKQTRLEPELIVFAGKQSLYRKEEKERRVFYMSWQRVAIAAALIGVMVSVWMLLPDNKINQQNLAQQVKTNHAASGTNHAAPTTADPTTKTIETQPGTNITSINKTGIDIVAPAGKENNKATVVVPATNNGNDLLAYNEPPPKVAEAGRGETVSTTTHNGFETAISSTESVSGQNSSAQNAEMIRTATSPDGSNDVQTAVYKELDTDDDKKSLLLGSLEINKDKLRGFFRKAGSLFRGKAKAADDDKTENHSPNTRSLK